MEKRVIEGRWWIAGTDNDVSGNLVCDEKGWNLELNGTFAVPTDESKKQALNQRHPRFLSTSEENTILGITKDGKPITLEYFPTKGSTVFLVGRGYDSDTYLIRRFFENAHFPNPKQITFKSVLVKFPHLFDWFGQSMVEVEREYDEKGAAKEARFICKPGGKISLGTIGNLSLSLRSYAKMPFFPLQDISIIQEAELIIESAEAIEMSLDEIRTMIITFKDFLTIAVGLNTSVQSVNGFTESNKEDLPDGKIFHPEVILHDKFIEPDAVPTRKIRREEMNFAFNDLSANAETILRNWFTKSQNLRDVFNLYFNTLAVPDLNLRNKFTSVVSAIEGLMRINNSTLRSERSLKKILNALQDLIKQHGFLFTADEIELIVNTRDKFAHIELTDGNRKTFDDYQLFDATTKLAAILEIALLLDIGFDQPSLQKIAKRKIAEAKR